MSTVTLEQTRALQTGVLGDATTAVTGSLLGTNVIELFTAPDAFDPTAVIGDYTLATYDGYASEAITWSAATLADDGAIETVGTVGEFRPTGATTENTIKGFLHRNAGGDILGGGTFVGEGLPMNSVLDSIIVVPRIRFNLNGLAEVVS